MRVTVVGAGALGTLYAAHLARAGHDVQLLARGARAALIAARGIRVSGSADFTTAVPVATDRAELKAADVLILAVKTYDTAAALEPLKGLDIGCAFSVQNGVQKDDALVARWGSAHVAGAISMIGGEVTTRDFEAHDQPLEVRFDMAAPTLLGSLSEHDPALEPVVDALQNAGLVAEARDDIRSVEWSKFVGWSGVSALAVLTRLPTATFLSNPETALVAARVMRETAAVARALGVHLDASGMARAEVLHGSESAAVTALLDQGQRMRQDAPRFRQSILQDADRGRPLEVDETLGYTLKEAERLQLATPTLDYCCRILRGISAAHRDSGSA